MYINNNILIIKLYFGKSIPTAITYNFNSKGAKKKN